MYCLTIDSGPSTGDGGVPRRLTVREREVRGR
jgi:hypothetical protein